MSTAARRRLMRDFKRLQSDPPQGVQGAPLEQNVSELRDKLQLFVVEECLAHGVKGWGAYRS